jgi:hypothetical protein
MDDMEYLVAETFKHFQETTSTAPVASFSYEMEEVTNGPGILYHLQKSASVFVIRSFVSQNMREDFRKIIDEPGNYPSLRLIEDESEVSDKLKFHTVENLSQAEIIHDQLNNRRFPIFEETMCNLSDPGFSWWLVKDETSFQITFNLSHLETNTVKLGPLSDHQLASKNLNLITEVIRASGIEYSIQNEGNRIRFGEENQLLKEEFQNLFEFGEISENLKGIFKMIARRSVDLSQVETCWLYLEEIAAMRRFWIQIQYELMT